MAKSPSNRDFNTRPGMRIESSSGNGPGGQHEAPRPTPLPPVRPASELPPRDTHVVLPPEQRKNGIHAIKDTLIKYKDAINQVIPRGVELDANTLITNTISYMTIAVRRDRNLQLCVPRSVLCCVMAAAKLGIDFVGDMAYMTAREQKNANKEHLFWYATFMPGYQGLITVAARHGYNINAQAVFTNDVFDIDLGQRWVTHKPFLDGPRGDFRGAYAMALRQQDLKAVFVDWMNKQHIDEIRGKSEAWQFHYAEMARSRPIRRVYKYLAKVGPQMALAAELSDRGDSGDSIDDLLGVDEMLRQSDGE